jgi:hypothetical protein
MMAIFKAWRLCSFRVLSTLMILSTLLSNVGPTEAWAKTISGPARTTGSRSVVEPPKAMNVEFSRPATRLAARPEKGSNASPQKASQDAASDAAQAMFVENVGQFDAQERFRAQGLNGILHVADEALWLSLVESPSAAEPGASPATPTADPSSYPDPSAAERRRGVNLKLSFIGANPNPEVEGIDPLDVKVSCFLGNDAENWRSNVPVWGGVRYVDIYPGVDLEVTGDGGQLSWQFVQYPVALEDGGLKALSRSGPRDAARMIAASVDLLVQIGIVKETRRVTSIAKVDKKLHGGEAWFIPLRRLEEGSSEEDPGWVLQETTA